MEHAKHSDSPIDIMNPAHPPVIVAMLPTGVASAGKRAAAAAARNGGSTIDGAAFTMRLSDDCAHGGHQHTKRKRAHNNLAPRTRPQGPRADSCR